MPSVLPTEAEAEQLLIRPGSVTWRFASDARLYLVMLYPLLLQVAHPTVAAGVRDFSDFETRPWERLLRTLDYVGLLVYGGQDAVAVGRRLRTLHKQFRGVREDGKRYNALEPEAYAWVHATLLESYVAGHAQFGTPMTREETETFYREYRGLGRLVGVREHDLPADWAGFREYFDRTAREELRRTESVERVLRAVTGSTPPPIALPDPLWRPIRFPLQRMLWIGGIGLMSPELRDLLEIRWGRTDQSVFRSLGALTRAVTPVIPRRLRVMGPDQLRLRRRAIAAGPLGPKTPAEEPTAATPSVAA
jgi:uncharacterized protein (DUF2236 family)